MTFNAPKRMALRGNTLLVADIDLSSGEPKPTGTAAVHRFDASGKPSAIAGGEQLRGQTYV